MNDLQTVMRLSSGQHLRLRLMGRGPAVVLLHESPRSSGALLALAGRIADRFTCVMLDSPGFGLSDPMPLSRPEIEDFAPVVIETIGRLRIGPVPVYGTHTGAAIAIEAAVQAPDLVSAALLDGYALFTPEEQAELLASYLMPFHSSLDGTHVAWLWARVRDQFAAFPWNRVSDGSRLPFGPPPLDFVNAVAEDFLMAGDAYRAGYAAAFRYDHMAPLSRSRVPVRLGTRVDDLLFPHMERARGAGALVTLQAFPADRDQWARDLAALMAEHAGAEAMDAGTLLARAGAHQGALRMVNTAGGPVAARIEGEGPPLLLLHDLPGGMADLDHLAERFRATHRVVRIELPGAGASRRAAPASPEEVARDTAEAVAALGAAGAPIVACGASLPVALRLDGPLIAFDPWPQVAPAQDLPDLSPRWDGTHLLAAFWWARDHEIYKPFSHRVNAEGRKLGNERDAERIDARFRAAFLGGTAGVETARALHAESCAAALAARGGQALILDTDPDHAALSAWAGEALGADRVRSVARAVPPIVAALRGMLG